jgi:pyruvate,water dikinase
MMGWRGVSRYLDPEFNDAFLMEVEALIRTHKKGLTNVVPMLPFVRHPEEAKVVTQIVRTRFEKAGLRCPKIIFMAEVPSLGFVPYLFNPYCDGYSFGTNDYTQLITGTDRDSPHLTFNEDIPAVRMAIATLADAGHREKPPKEFGICGQAPSDLPKFLRFLAVYLDYISVNPDAVTKTIKKLAEVERDLRQLILGLNKNPKKIALELSKEFNLWNPFDPSMPGVTEFRVRWLMRKLGVS